MATLISTLVRLDERYDIDVVGELPTGYVILYRYLLGLCDNLDKLIIEIISSLS